MYYTLTAVWGVGQGIHIANLLAVIHDYCGANQLALLFGVHLCAEGVGALIGAPISSEYYVKLHHKKSDPKALKNTRQSFPNLRERFIKT